jgi:hypothetical protein
MSEIYLKSTRVRYNQIWGAVVIVVHVRLRTTGVMFAIVLISACSSSSAATTSADEMTVPFAWQGSTWCPTYQGINGCNNIQRFNTSTTYFYRSQVRKAPGSNYIILRMNSTGKESGAIDTQPYRTWRAPALISEQIDLPCNSSGQIENWPAFWLLTTGSWPAGGEIDVMEGLNGSAAWHYHYLNSSGATSAVGGTLSGFSGCGTHTYAVSWTTSAITFYYDGKQAGRVTPYEIGVPIASGPMYVVNDYAASSTYGGPTVGNVSMEVLKFTATNTQMMP